MEGPGRFGDPREERALSIGQTLAEARERAGLTVEDVAARTRLRRTLVVGIEADDFSACGGDFYARGHVRNVAKVVGIDPEPLLAEFDASRPDAAPPRASDVFESEAARPERRGPNWSAAMAAALVLVVVYGIAQVLSGGGDGDQAVTEAGGGTASPKASHSSSPAAPSPTTSADSSAVAQAPRDKVTVAVKARGTSWVQVTTASGKELFEGLLENRTMTFTDKNRVQIVVGNAGAISLTVNGTEIGSPGKQGQVARVRFTPDDPAAG
jgi:cytoskeletal protein RodZ